jgi:hypothetical protein
MELSKELVWLSANLARLLADLIRLSAKIGKICTVAKRLLSVVCILILPYFRRYATNACRYNRMTINDNLMTTNDIYILLFPFASPTIKLSNNQTPVKQANDHK